MVVVKSGRLRLCDRLLSDPTGFTANTAELTYTLARLGRPCREIEWIPYQRARGPVQSRRAESTARSTERAFARLFTSRHTRKGHLTRVVLAKVAFQK